MSDDPQTTDHPFDALASYVDGSADPAERAAAEAHLQTCDRCRRDAGLASTGRSALRVLPEVEAPGLAATVAASLGIDAEGFAAEPAPAGPTREAGEDGQDRSQRRARRWQAVWGAGLAAAAVLAAVLIYMGVVSGGGSGGQAAAPATSAPTDVRGPGVTLDTKAVDRLAASLARGGAPAPIAAPSVAEGSQRELSGAEAETAEACARSAGSVDASATASEVLSATFRGTAAYVGAFDTGNQVQVIVASRAGCQPLYVASARKG